MEYLDTQAAARFLGVKTRTLYSYASRGLLRSEPLPGSRSRQYAVEDLERLKARHDARAGHGPVAASALQFGQPVLATAVSGIGPEGPIYRGKSAIQLARDGASFEAASELLWTGTLPTRAVWEPSDAVESLRDLQGVRPAKGRVGSLSLLLAAAARLASTEPPDADASLDAELRRARALVRTLAALAGADVSRRNTAAVRGTVAEVLASALGVAPARARGAIDFALVVAADHELNASTFAVRVIASTGAGLHASVAGGLAALTGPRHGGMTERIEAVLETVDGAARARAVVRAHGESGTAIPGFGHPLYPGGDPRAAALIDLATEVAGKRSAILPHLALVRAMERAGRGAPNLDYGLVTLARALGLPRGSASLVFAVGRVAGWVAHALEQRATGQLLRPRASYVGPAR